MLRNYISEQIKIAVGMYEVFKFFIVKCVINDVLDESMYIHVNRQLSIFNNFRRTSRHFYANYDKQEIT